MNNTENIVRVAVVQAAPVLMNWKATTEKTFKLTLEAGEKGAKLVLFPEAFIPAYPRGLSFGTKVGSLADSGRKD